MCVCVCEEGGMCLHVCRGRCVSIYVSVREMGEGILVRVFVTSLVPRQHYVSIWK